MTSLLHLYRGAGNDGMPLLALHDLGSDGSEWSDLLAAWPGPSAAPDLPGHGQSPPAEGGKYVPTDLTLAALRALQQLGWHPGSEPKPAVIGRGWGAYAAEYLAAAGRVSALYLVDGLGGPWSTVDEVQASQAAWLRAALELHGQRPSTPDPLWALGFPTVWEEEFTRARRSAITVPVVAFETPASPTPADQRQSRATMFGGPAAVHAIELADLAGQVVTHGEAER